VAMADGEFTSAISAPSLPSEVAGNVLGIEGLQPQVRARHRQHGGASAGGLGSPNGAPTPADIAYAYNFPSNLTGAGQAIAIIIDAAPATSDLTQFWTACGIAQSLANYTVIGVNGGPSPSGDVFEATLDVEWASSMAPGAAIRLYAIPNLSYFNMLSAAVQISNDLATCPGLHQVSISFDGPEGQAGGTADLLNNSQVFAQLAAAGVTVFACTGDGGSNPNIDPDVLQYGPSNPLEVEYPASDPNLTAVGGTALVFGSNWIPENEIAWFSSTEPDTSFTVGTGGGFSTCFSHPTWQTGSGVPPGGARCVPDVSAQANLGYLVMNGQGEVCWGTSLAAPIWAAACATINQSRTQLGQPPLGLLGPLIYPLLGTDSFHDITSGGNGSYSAGSGYDLCTGLGTPNVANLVGALTVSSPPSITLQPASQTVANGRSVVFNVAAAGMPAPTYQWTFNGAAIPHATDPILEVSAVAGTYACLVSNSSGTVSSSSAALAVVATSTPGYLVNLSARGDVSTGANILIGGFTFLGGSGSKQVLIRGIGPGLNYASGSFAGFVPSPTLTLFDSTQAQIGQNNAWGGTGALTAVFNSLGAFPLNPTSADAALLTTLPAGGAAGFTAQVSSGAGGAGTGMVEIYDADSGAPAIRLGNISARAVAGTGQNILIGGFVIGGNTGETVLLRAVGPGLTDTFNLTGTLSQPVLTLYSGASPIAANTGWNNDATIAATAHSVGAFPLQPYSRDSALLVTLPPGNYTALVTGVAGTTGLALIEIYEVP